MPLDLDVYLKRKPDFEGFLREDVGLKPEGTHPRLKVRTYGWFPTNERRARDFVYVREYFEPSLYPHVTYDGCHDIGNIVKETAREGIALPQDFIKKVKKDEDRMVADEEMYQILQNHQGLENLLREYQPFWGILRFSHGEPTYWVTLVAKLNAPKNVVTGMSRLAQFLATRYDGLVWDDQTGQFGKPEAETLHQLGSALFDTFTSSLDKAGFKWEPF